MDVRDINNVFVPQNCDRTAGSAETIDGASVTGVQIWAPILDDGNDAGTYYGPGELLVTDPSGLALTATTADSKLIEAIQLHMRSADGLNHFGFMDLKGANIKSYNLMPYKAPSEQVSVVHTITTTIVAGTSYQLKLRRTGSETSGVKYNTVGTVEYIAQSGDAAAEVYTGLIAALNTKFNTDIILPVIAAATTGGTGTGFTITALPLPWELGKFFYKKLEFVVELINFDATVVDNTKADLTVNTVTFDHKTKGSGTYYEAAEADRFAVTYTGANKDKLSPVHTRKIVANNADTAETYDKVVITWENIQGAFSANVRQEGSVTLFLPVTDNGTNQVGVASIGIMAVLDAYIVTAWGVGTAQIGNIT